MSQATLDKAGALGSGGVQFLKGSLWGYRVAGPGLTGPQGPGLPGEVGPAPQLPEGGA